MTDRPATQPADGRATPAWFVIALFAMAALLAYAGLWRWAATPGSFFGGDLIAYTSAADRLVTTGSPYDPLLLAGPIDNRAENVSIGYFYPPVLAQLFLPLRAIPHFTLAVAWSAAQAICLAILLPLTAGGRGPYRWDRALLAIGFGLAFYPLQFAIFGGNVSGWLAIGVALSLVAAARLRGSVAAVATCIKLTPLPMFVAALTDRRSRLAAVVPLSIIVIVSVLLAPLAWSDFIKVLPNILRNGMAEHPTNLSPANALGAFGLLGLGSLVGWALAIGFGVAAVVMGIRGGYSNRVVALAILSVTFVSSTLWDHYLAVFVPLVLWSWPSAGSRVRLAIGAFVVLATGLWVRLDVNPEYRLVLVASLVICSLAIASIPDSAVGARMRSAHGA
jgi:hypothetical protein